MSLELRPIGRVESPLTDLASAPKQGDEGAPDAWLALEPGVAAGLEGLVSGARVVVLTWLDRAPRDVLRVHPRGDTDVPEQGVFTTRSPGRPNPIGLHDVEVLAVDGARVHVRGLEAVDGTPVLDLKPALEPIGARGARPSGPTLAAADVAGRLPATDLGRARRFYADKLGLEPAEERPGGLLYRGRSGVFALFASGGAASGTHTQLGFDVDDLAATVAELRRRGVVFEEVDVPGLRTVDGIATVEGNYPSKGGRGERAAWLRDSEGNLLGIGQALR